MQRWKHTGAGVFAVCLAASLWGFLRPVARSWAERSTQALQRGVQQGGGALVDLGRGIVAGPIRKGGTMLEFLGTVVLLAGLGAVLYVRRPLPRPRRVRPGSQTTMTALSNHAPDPRLVTAYVEHRQARSIASTRSWPANRTFGANGRDVAVESMATVDRGNGNRATPPCTGECPSFGRGRTHRPRLRAAAGLGCRFSSPGWSSRWMSGETGARVSAICACLPDPRRRNAERTPARRCLTGY